VFVATQINATHSLNEQVARTKFSQVYFKIVHNI
jgi:hypothetical protein